MYISFKITPCIYRLMMPRTTSYSLLYSQANDAEDYFPLWGTCQGFQLLTNLTARQNLLVPTDSENISLPLDLKPGDYVKINDNKFVNSKKVNQIY